ncbi:MAG: hypothetical protein ABI175_01600, partial [Polyangiales bacterium]
MKSSSFTIGLSLAVAGAASAALLVRPPSTPERTATAATVNAGGAGAPDDPFVKGAINAKNAAGNMVAGLGPSPAIAVKGNARKFSIDVLAIASWGDGPA